MAGFQIAREISSIVGGNEFELMIREEDAERANEYYDLIEIWDGGADVLLVGKTAVVTGANGGIGRAICKVFLENGATVIGLIHRNQEGLDERIKYYSLDLSDTSACEKTFGAITEITDKVDILVNCAGITRDAMSSKMSEQQWDEVIDVNLKSVWNLTRLIGPMMQKNHTGSIINISSVVGVFGNIGQVNYAASKAGLIGLTKSFAKELAHRGGNVRVNAVAPGYTMTNMMKTVPDKLLEQFKGQTMLGRLADPYEIANAVLFLASDLSSYVTGEVLNVNGGMRL